MVDVHRKNTHQTLLSNQTATLSSPPSLLPPPSPPSTASPSATTLPPPRPLCSVFINAVKISDPLTAQNVSKTPSTKSLSSVHTLTVLLSSSEAASYVTRQTTFLGDKTRVLGTRSVVPRALRMTMTSLNGETMCCRILSRLN